MLSRLLFISLLILISHGLSCASRFEASGQYKSAVYKNQFPQSKRTVLLFLVDGLSASTLKNQLNRGKLPSIKKHFLRSKKEFHLARTGFPSITYPSVASLLTERPIDQHGIYGNKIFARDKYYNFESPSDFNELNNLTAGKTIYHRLKEKKLSSVSFSFTFNQAATASIENFDITSALSVQSENFAYIDTKLIEGLEILLKETPSHRWPAFIYVHLVGIDFLSHKYGPDSPRVISYLQTLDKKLKRIFRLLEKVEAVKRRNIVTLLTSDHGYDQRIQKTIKLKSLLPSGAENVLNESRFVSFKFPAHWKAEQKVQYTYDLKQDPSIDIIAYRDQQSVQVMSQEFQTQIFYGPSTCKESEFSMSVGMNFPTKICPQQLPYHQNQLFYPYFITHISQYFYSRDHSDVVIIPKPGISFSFDYRGQHGGPTPNEIFVPLLIRNGTLPPSNEVMPLSDVLKFL